MRVVSAFVFVAVVASSAWGQTSFTATYDLSGGGNNVTSFDYNGTSYPGISPGALVKVGITSSSSTGNYRGSVWPTGATSGSDVFAGTVDLGYYIGFTVDAVSGYKFTVTSLTFGVGRSSTGPRQWQWRGSGDSYGSIMSDYTTVNAGLTNSSGELTNPDANSSWTGNVLDVSSGYADQTGTVGFRLYGYNSGSTSGTGGLQGDITISGTYESLGGTPTKLVTTSVNGGASPSADTPFDVVIQSQDNSDIGQNVSANTDISLALQTGTGSLAGTLSGTIAAGSNIVTISGVTYNTAESVVSITAARTSGDALSAGTSASFTVLSAASQLAFVGVPTAGQQGVNLSSFTVEARRGDNSVDQNFAGEVTVAKASGGGNISGTLTQTAVSGVATFDDIQFDAGGDYTISASSTGLTGASSGTISILSTTLPLVEDFEYTPATTLVSNGWVAHSGAGTNSITVSSGALTYPGYSESGVGNKVTVGNTGEDVNRTFAGTSAGSVYASFMVNVSAATTTGDYFFNLGRAGTTYYYARVFAMVDGSNNLAFGIAKNVVASAAYTAFDYSLNTTYLLTVQYTFNSGTITDDQVDLWINPSLSGPPAPPSGVSQTDAGTDALSLGMVALRQGSSSSAPTLTLGGIKVGQQWSDVPLPVAMSTMAAAVEGGKVCLNFSTATEIDVAGFNILRATSKTGPFDLASSYTSNAALKATGTATNGGSYAFVDSRVLSGKTYFYRIDAVSTAGRSQQVGRILEVEVAVPKNFAVYQNYPNPFNPLTAIGYQLSAVSRVTLTVYDLMGRRIAVLAEGIQPAGIHSVVFDASDVASGVYIYRLDAVSPDGYRHAAVRKMILVK